MFSIAPHFFIPYAVSNVVLLLPIWVGQRGGDLKIKPYILESLQSFFVFSFGVMGQTNWLVAKKKKKKGTWEAPHLMNRGGE
jgi:hypothetical protein